jgi:hypothetical protein
MPLPPPSIQYATFETYQIPAESIWMYKPILGKIVEKTVEKTAEKTVEKTVEKTIKAGDSRRGSRILT